MFTRQTPSRPTYCSTVDRTHKISLGDVFWRLGEYLSLGRLTTISQQRFEGAGVLWPGEGVIGVPGWGNGQVSSRTRRWSVFSVADSVVARTHIVDWPRLTDQLTSSSATFGDIQITCPSVDGCDAIPVIVTPPPAVSCRATPPKLPLLGVIVSRNVWQAELTFIRI